MMSQRNLLIVGTGVLLTVGVLFLLMSRDDAEPILDETLSSPEDSSGSEGTPGDDAEPVLEIMLDENTLKELSSPASFDPSILGARAETYFVRTADEPTIASISLNPFFERTLSDGLSVIVRLAAGHGAEVVAAEVLVGSSTGLEGSNDPVPIMLVRQPVPDGQDAASVAEIWQGSIETTGVVVLLGLNVTATLGESTSLVELRF